MVVRENHVNRVAFPPPGFRLLATSNECEVEAVAHEHMRVYGVQFHPERPPPDLPLSRKVLENFLELAISS